MCKDGARLYAAYAASVPQVKPGDTDIKAKLAVRSPESERARLAYEKHCKECKTCLHETITGAQYLMNAGYPVPTQQE